ncbi:TVP38/TMEM64 family protein [Asticcacaulis solisilvae]|uniref:TVP38/TMEM64 family protein n=1 Tax=Asticcacaulis solisilvae TaxID=1217274 RepID=UPI003FD848BF
MTAAALAVVVLLQLHVHLDLQPLRDLVAASKHVSSAHPLAFAVIFFCAYVVTTAMCIPFEIPFALLAGAFFGLAGGVVVASFASVIGATIAFLLARHLLRDRLQRRFGSRLEALNRGFARDGIVYLINLRLLPVVPFSLCNPLMGLTTMPVVTFFAVSQACMIFATVIFVNAGTQIATLQTTDDIMTPRMLVSLAALGVLPFLAKVVLRAVAPDRSGPLAVK